jgi:L-threonylcarbamoyladenylate synthase
VSYDEQIAEAVNVLRTGGVVLLPTDTVYGLAVSPEHPSAVDKLYILKKRPPQRNLPVMVSSIEMLRRLGVVIHDSATRLLNSPLVPGALTLALGVHAAHAPLWLAHRDEVAVRIPDDQRLLSIIERSGPLLVTSANSHGLVTPNNLADALTQLEGLPDFAIDGGILPVVPSTLVNCRRDPPVVEREGVIPRSRIEEVLRCPKAN